MQNDKARRNDRRSDRRNDRNNVQGSTNNRSSKKETTSESRRHHSYAGRSESRGRETSKDRAARDDSRSRRTEGSRDRYPKDESRRNEGSRDRYSKNDPRSDRKSSELNGSHRSERRINNHSDRKVAESNIKHQSEKAPRKSKSEITKTEQKPTRAVHSRLFEDLPSNIRRARDKEIRKSEDPGRTVRNQQKSERNVANDNRAIRKYDTEINERHNRRQRDSKEQRKDYEKVASFVASDDYVPRPSKIAPRRNSQDKERQKLSDHKEDSRHSRSRKVETKVTKSELVPKKAVTVLAGNDESENEISENVNFSEEANKGSANNEISENEIDDNYEDDFEDYESDFENDDEEEEEDDDNDLGDSDKEEINSKMIMAGLNKDSDDGTVNIRTIDKPSKKSERRSIAEDLEKQSVLQAMREENMSAEMHQRLKPYYLPVHGDTEGAESADSGIDTIASPVRKSSGLSTSHSFINFASAKQRQISKKTLSKTLTRKIGLLDSNRIALNIMSYDIFDLPSIDYETYIKSFGKSNTQQAYCYTNDDYQHEEIQTDPILVKEKWTQHPAQDYKGVGGNTEEIYDSDKIEEIVKMDVQRLSKFIQAAGEVMVGLLEEENQTFIKPDSSQSRGNASFSDGFVKLGQLPFRRDCPVTYINFAPSESHLLITIHGTATEIENEIDEKGLLCVWNIHQPSFPQKILICSSQPTCACFSPGKANLAFAGMVDGSIALWDLAEPSSMHKILATETDDYVLRCPTYSTAEVLKDESHHSPITAISSILMEEEGQLELSVLNSSSDKTENQLSIQLATVEEYDIIKLWTIVEVAKPDPSGMDSDLGLSPGGKLRIIRSLTINLQDCIGPELQMKNKDLPVRALDVQFLPRNCNHLFVGTDLNLVLHCSRHGDKMNPSSFRADTDAITDVTTVDFFRNGPPYFLVGCRDGSVRLHAITKSKPLLSWPNAAQGEEILKVHWSTCKINQFFVLDNASNIYVWDLEKSLSFPISVKNFTEGRVIHFHMNNTLDWSNNGNSVSGSQLAIAYDTGIVEIHQIAKEFTTNDKKEVDEFLMFLNDLCF